MKRTQSFLKLGSLVAGLFFSTGLLFSQAESIGICIDWAGGNRYDVKVSDYNDVDFFQFTLSWDPDIASFIEARSYAELDVDYNDWNQDFLDEGNLRVLHLKPGLEGISLEDGTVILSVFLDSDNPIASLPRITGNELSIEVGRENGLVFDFITEGLDCQNLERALVTGRMTQSADLTCSEDDVYEVQSSVVTIRGGVRTYHASTHEDGYYYAFLPVGTYTIDGRTDSTLYEQCASTDIITVASTDETIEHDLHYRPLRLCSQLEVSLATSRLRSCITSTYIVTYNNLGTATASNPEVLIELPEGLEGFASDASYTALDDNKFLFTLEELRPREDGQFTFTCHVSCDELSPLTYCAKATITLGEECLDTDPRWSGASITVDATCEGEEITFLVTNQGDASTSSPRHVAIIRNDEGYDEDDVLLAAGESKEYRIDADGATYRIMVDQEAYHPGNSQPTIALEACGSSDAQLGFVTQFNEDDGNDFVDIFCLRAVNSYDPNDKLAHPRGVTDAGYIQRAKTIDYTIRFQNTGSDTAYLVVIRDTLDELLNPSTIRAVIASHDVDFELRGEGEVIFTFRDINLIDSLTNEAASHGFVRFTIDPIKDLEVGSTFSNDASIYFDRNPPILTNEVRHTISQDFISVLSSTLNLSSSSELILSPNPVSSQGVITLEIADQDIYSYTLYDTEGKIITGGTQSGRQINLAAHALSSGLYILRVDVEGKIPYIAKLIITENIK